jgi:hypothetical protein
MDTLHLLSIFFTLLTIEVFNAHFSCQHEELISLGVASR